jgi:hypothetical protein
MSDTTHTHIAWENEVDYDSHPEIDKRFDEHTEEWYKLIPDLPKNPVNKIRIYENNKLYASIDAEELLDKSLNCKFKELVEELPFNPAHFAYPQTVQENYLFAEDIEEAIIQYLGKGGLDEEELRLSHFYFKDGPQGKETNVQYLTINWK